VEKGNLEVLRFAIRSKVRANNKKPYTPREGKMIADINRVWEELEKAEHERELALRDEFIRLTYLHCSHSNSTHQWRGSATGRVLDL